jgi:hypothetical protein
VVTFVSPLLPLLVAIWDHVVAKSRLPSECMPYVDKLQLKP